MFTAHVHCVCDPVTSQTIDAGQYTFNIFFLFKYFFHPHISSILYFFFPSVFSLRLHLFFVILFCITNLFVMIFLYQLPFFLVSSILPLLLAYFSSSSVQCLFHTCFLDSYTSFITLYKTVPPFRKPFRAFLAIPLFSYYVACLASYPQPSKASSPQSASQCFMFQVPVTFLFLKVIQQLRTPSSTSSLPFCLSCYLSCSNVVQKAVPTQDVTDPVSLPTFYCLQDIPFLLDCP